MKIFYSALAILAYVVAPASLIWGWVRWARLPKWRTIPSTFAFIGFICASGSGIFGLAAVLIAQAGGIDGRAFRFCFLSGTLLSLAGFFFAIGGVWRKNPLQWLAPASAVATLAFWVLATAFID